MEYVQYHPTSPPGYMPYHNAPMPQASLAPGGYNSYFPHYPTPPATPSCGQLSAHTRRAGQARPLQYDYYNCYSPAYEYIPFGSKSNEKHPRPQRSSYSSQPPHSKANKISPRKATPEDARRHGIPEGYSYKNWDPTEEPILLLGSVFDANSLGKWIYDWTVYHNGPSAPLSEIAGDLWLLLVQLAGKSARVLSPNTGNQQDSGIAQNIPNHGNWPWTPFAKSCIKMLEQMTGSVDFNFQNVYKHLLRLASSPGSTPKFVGSHKPGRLLSLKLLQSVGRHRNWGIVFTLFSLFGGASATDGVIQQRSGIIPALMAMLLYGVLGPKRLALLMFGLSTTWPIVKNDPRSSSSLLYGIYISSLVATASYGSVTLSEHNKPAISSLIAILLSAMLLLATLLWSPDGIQALLTLLPGVLSVCVFFVANFHVVKEYFYDCLAAIFEIVAHIIASRRVQAEDNYTTSQRWYTRTDIYRELESGQGRTALPPTTI